MHDCIFASCFSHCDLVAHRLPKSAERGRERIVILAVFAVDEFVQAFVSLGNQCVHWMLILSQERQQVNPFSRARFHRPS